MMYDEYLMHFGVKGMKWGVRKKRDYHSKGIRAYIARKQNDKVDKSFNIWKEEAAKRDEAIRLGKIANEKRMAANDDPALKKDFKQANKQYKKMLNANTTYRKGQIKYEVGSNLSRKYLSKAKKIEKQLQTDPNNKSLKKQYAKSMSKHDIERRNARKAPDKYARRSRAAAAIKRSMTIAIKSAVISTAIAGGTVATKAILDRSKGIRVDSAGKYYDASKDLIGKIFKRR